MNFGPVCSERASEQLGDGYQRGVLDTSGPVVSVVKESKSEVLFCSAPPHTYTDPATFDGADLSNLLLPASAFMPVVGEFP